LSQDGRFWVVQVHAVILLTRNLAVANRSCICII